MEAEKETTTDGIVWKAAMAAIALGVLVTAFLVYENASESYSALYLKPDSYSNYLTGKTVKFTYGVQCFENGKTDYDLKVFLNGTQVVQKQFSIEGGGNSLEDNISFDVPSKMEFPTQVALVLTANGQSYSTHFWLKGMK